MLKFESFNNQFSFHLFLISLPPKKFVSDFLEKSSLHAHSNLNRTLDIGFLKLFSFDCKTFKNAYSRILGPQYQVHGSLFLALFGESKLTHWFCLIWYKHLSNKHLPVDDGRGRKLESKIEAKMEAPITNTCEVTFEQFLFVVTWSCFFHSKKTLTSPSFSWWQNAAP